MVDAHIIYSQDTSKNFEVEHVCLLLKDQPKFDAEFMSKVMKDKNVNTSKLIKLKEAWERCMQEHERRMEYEILMKDTFNMFEQQRWDQEKYCDHIRKKTNILNV